MTTLQVLGVKPSVWLGGDFLEKPVTAVAAMEDELMRVSVIVQLLNG